MRLCVDGYDTIGLSVSKESGSVVLVDDEGSRPNAPILVMSDSNGMVGPIPEII